MLISFMKDLSLFLDKCLKEDEKNLTTQAGISAQLIITVLEGNIGRYIRSKFKDSPSTLY